MAFPHTLTTVSDRFAWALDNVLGGLTSTSEPDVAGRGPHWVTFLCGLMGAIALVVAAFVLFRPSRGRRSLDAADEQRIRTLLARYGDQDSLGYFATRRDKAAYFPDSGKSAITYRVIAGVSLASGDPLGEVAAWPEAIKGWLCDRALLRLDARGHGSQRDGGQGLRRRRAQGLRPRGRRRFWRSATSRSKVAPCAWCARRSAGSSGPATPCGCAGTASSPRRRWPR